MREESFEDRRVAQLMNETFVNIKVDREERPDVDMVYMAVCQMMTGSGGWPLTIIMTPDKMPFLAATYIPKQNQFGKMGMLQLVPKVRRMWADDRKELLVYGKQVTDALMTSISSSVPGDPDPSVMKLAFGELNGNFDPEFGGFGEAPKFPSPHNYMFLLRYWKDRGDARALEMTERSLDRMQSGGIWDHLEGGFHRYSTDRRWLIPHFEKMLYDQAMMVAAYSEAFQATKNESYAGVVDDTLRYLLGRMKSAEGGFCSSEDADSEGSEGKFYLWTVDEFRSVLGQDAELFLKVFGLDETSGVGDSGGHVLEMRRRPREWAHELGVSEGEFVSRLESARSKLRAARDLRVRPKRDDKVLCDWNGLVLVALAKASRALGRYEYALEGESLADFLLSRMKGSDGHLIHARRGEMTVPATLDDYAFVIWGLLELYESTFETRLLKASLSLAREMVSMFWDETSSGFFFTSKGTDYVLARQKTFYDSAVPSGNSVAAYALMRLGRVSGDSHLDRVAFETMEASWGSVVSAPAGHTMLLSALDYYFGPSSEVVIAGSPQGADTLEMAKAVNGAFLPNTILLLHSIEDTTLEGLAPFVSSMKEVGGQATAYVCRSLSCLLPTNIPSEMMANLEERIPSGKAASPDLANSSRAEGDEA